MINISIILVPYGTLHFLGKQLHFQSYHSAVACGVDTGSAALQRTQIGSEPRAQRATAPPSLRTIHSQCCHMPHSLLQLVAPWFSLAAKAANAAKKQYQNVPSHRFIVAQPTSSVSTCHARGFRLYGFLTHELPCCESHICPSI